MREGQQKCSKNRQFLANKSPYLKNGASQDHSHNDRLIGSRIHTFDWYQNHRPWMTVNDLERPKRNACTKDASFGAHCTNLNEDRPIHAATKMQANDSSSSIVRHVLLHVSVAVVGLVCSCLRSQCKPKTTYLDNSSFCYHNIQHYNNYQTRHNDVKVVFRQPVCHYTAPLLGGIKTKCHVSILSIVVLLFIQ